MAFGLLLALAAMQPGPLAGQQRDSLWTRSSPFLVKYGKWGTLAAAVGMGLKAAEAHRDADRAFDRLEDYCGPDPARCDQGPDGSYSDPAAERYYQASLRHDRRARRWLLGGEVALLGTAGLFVWELTRPKRLPDNIPFEPEISVLPHESRFGLRIGF
jgi:hypothetical protein